MNDDITMLGNVRVFSCRASGRQISTEADINDLIGTALGERADLVALPVERLTQGFLELRTGFAGLLVQKFANYRLRLAIIGDMEGACARSKALKDFVYEANRGAACWFLRELSDLNTRMAQ